jgi:myo-inositol-1(or 4)-monophosphatase
VAEALLRAGKIALDHFHRPAVSVKHDMTLVTEADHEIEQKMIEYFYRPDDGIYFVGEETIADSDNDYLERAFTERTFIVDPIDGTAPFAHGFPTWGISIGYAEDGFFREGALFLPTSGQLLITDGDTVYLGRLGPVPVDWDPARMVPFMLPEELEASQGIISVSQDVVKRGGFDGREAVFANGSAVYSIAHLAMGSFIGYIANLKVWDIAGGWPIVRRLGFEMSFADGTPVSDRPIAECFNLEADASRRWRLRAPLFIARDHGYLDSLRARAGLG